MRLPLILLFSLSLPLSFFLPSILSIVSILHNSFYATAIESSTSYIAVIMSILGNVLFAVHRSVQLIHNIDLVQFARMYLDKIVIQQLRMSKQSNLDAVLGTAPNQNAQSNRTSPKQTAQSNPTTPRQTAQSNRNSPPHKSPVVLTLSKIDLSQISVSNPTTARNKAQSNPTTPRNKAQSNPTTARKTAQSNPTSPRKTAQSNPTTPRKTAQSNQEIEMSDSFSDDEDAIELEKMHHNHRVYLVLQFLR